jgi:hypothetical protein
MRIAIQAGAESDKQCPYTPKKEAHPIMKKKKWWIAIIAVAVLYIVFFPSPSPELAVRKHLLLSFHPMMACLEPIQEGNIKNDPRYGDLYLVDASSRPFVYVKKSALGWRVSSAGTGP